MEMTQVLIDQELTDTLEMLCAKSAHGTLSFLSSGKWETMEIKFCSAADDMMILQALPDEHTAAIDIQIYQPVGISMPDQDDTYIFETAVAVLETAVNASQRGMVILEMPRKIEKVQRRSYARVPVPEKMKVNTLFWHRGYKDSSKNAPAEQYWQGRLADLSAGGLQIVIDIDQETNFSVDQFIGVQFTPMSYQTPIITEAKIKHIAKNTSREHICLGVEFVGLEASDQGRTAMKRIIETITEYNTINRTNK